MPDGRERTSPPSLGHRRYVVVSRYPNAMVAFGQPATYEQAFEEAERVRESGTDNRRVGVFELRLVRS